MAETGGLEILHPLTFSKGFCYIFGIWVLWGSAKILGNTFHFATAKFSLSYFDNAWKIFWVTIFTFSKFMVSCHRACFHCLLKFALSWDLSDSCLIVELETCSDSCPAIISSSRHLYTSLSPPFVSSGLNETSSSCLSTSCPASYRFPCSDFKKTFHLLQHVAL